MSLSNKILINFCYFSLNTVNSYAFSFEGSGELQMNSIIYENNNNENIVENNNKEGGFLKTIFCPKRILNNIRIMESYSQKFTVGIELIDSDEINKYSSNELIINISNSIFFKNAVNSSYSGRGVAIFMDTNIKANLKNTIFIVTYFSFF